MQVLNYYTNPRSMFNESSMQWKFMNRNTWVCPICKQKKTSKLKPQPTPKLIPSTVSLGSVISSTTRGKQTDSDSARRLLNNHPNTMLFSTAQSETVKGYLKLLAWAATDKQTYVGPVLRPT